MLTANTLIHQYGGGAEEYVSQQLWKSQQRSDEKDVARWRSLLDAIKKVREIRDQIKK
jgi:hypothetical protein